jgi:hypothetical protein
LPVHDWATVVGGGGPAANAACSSEGESHAVNTSATLAATTHRNIIVFTAVPLSPSRSKG